MEGNSEEIKNNSFFSVERVEPMFAGGKRDWSVDVLRCLSCFLVCVIHSTRLTVAYGHADIGANIWLHNEIYAMIAGAPTVLFVMVSGIFFLSPERNVRIGRVWRKNILKMACTYIFWCMIYACYDIYLMDPQPEITVSFFLQRWIIEPTHLWYIPMIIGLYMICPILRPITATGDTKLFKYIVAIFMAGLTLWSIYYWPGFAEEGGYVRTMIDKTPMSILCQYPFWMLFGWIAYSYRPNKKFRRLIYAVGLAAVAVGFAINIHNWIMFEDVNYLTATQKFSILSFLKNTALFYFVITVFRDHQFTKVGKAFLKRWSDYTLIIYLIHYLLLKIMFYYNFLYDTGVSPWIAVWVYAIVAYVVGGVVALIFHLVWDPIKKACFKN